MFLPRSKYKIKQASWGQFVLSGSLGSYVGPYIEDYLGRTYAGDSLEGAEDRVLVPVQNDSVKLVPAKKLEILPTVKDYERGNYTRYFRQNRSTKVVEEVDEQTYRDSNVKAWKTVSCYWRVIGDLDDQLIYGYIWHGIRWRNQKTLELLDKTIPGIVEALELKPEDFVKES